jgi:hypothetical protein
MSRVIKARIFIRHIFVAGEMDIFGPFYLIGVNFSAPMFTNRVVSERCKSGFIIGQVPTDVFQRAVKIVPAVAVQEKKI